MSVSISLDIYCKHYICSPYSKMLELNTPFGISYKYILRTGGRRGVGILDPWDEYKQMFVEQVLSPYDQT